MGSAIEYDFKKTTKKEYPFVFRGQKYYISNDAVSPRSVVFNELNQAILPEPYSISTSVNGYGGKCFCLYLDGVIFNNKSDGELYYFDIINSRVAKLSIQIECADVVGYADLVVSDDCSFLVAVQERGDLSESTNSLVAIDLSNHSVYIVAQDADFYANPTISFGKNNRFYVAWVQWNHPYMPWDESGLFCCELLVNNDSFVFGETQSLDQQRNRSISQIGFVSYNSIIYCADDDEYDKSQFFSIAISKTPSVLTNENVEFGECHWNFGQSRWQRLNDQFIVAIGTDEHGDALYVIDIIKNKIRRVSSYAVMCEHISFSEDLVALTIHQESSDSENIYLKQESLIKAYNGKYTFLLDQGSPSIFKKIKIQNGACGYYHPPLKEAYLPPLIVIAHGGPTSRVAPKYNMQRHFFNANGYGVLEISHRGCAGSGRFFRQSLLGGWGVMECEDLVAITEKAVSLKLANPNMLFVHGQSAGGYTVLRLLTTAKCFFAGGACYYGIADLEQLSKVTHKFEKHYTDQLLGIVNDNESNKKKVYYNRSPIHSLRAMNAPLIFFQGSKDKVVPASMSRNIDDKINKKKTAFEYVEYQGEGHGFRNIDNKSDALIREITFFNKICYKNTASCQ